MIGSGFILYSAGGSSEWDAVIYSLSLLAWKGRRGLLICIFGEITASDLTARGKLEESQALRGIIQFRDFPVQGSRRIRFSKVQGFILWLYMSSQRKFIAFHFFPFPFVTWFSFPFISLWLSGRGRVYRWWGVAAAPPPPSHLKLHLHPVSPGRFFFPLGTFNASLSSVFLNVCIHYKLFRDFLIMLLIFRRFRCVLIQEMFTSVFYTSIY